MEKKNLPNMPIWKALIGAVISSAIIILPIFGAVKGCQFVSSVYQRHQAAKQEIENKRLEKISELLLLVSEGDNIISPKETRNFLDKIGYHAAIPSESEVLIYPYTIQYEKQKDLYEVRLSTISTRDSWRKGSIIKQLTTPDMDNLISQYTAEQQKK